MTGLLSKRLRALALPAMVLALSACGGKHASSQQETTAPSSQTPAPVVLPTASVSGVFDGTLTDSGQAATAVLETDGSYYLVYSGSDQMPAGAIIGTSTNTSGSYVSNDAADLSLIGSGSQTPATGALNGSLSPGKSFSGLVTYSASKPSVAFSTSFNNAFATLPPMSALAGTYIGAIATKSLKEDKLQLVITADGKVTSKLSCGCNVNATLSPRADGAAYIVTLQFSGGDHPLTNKNMAGDVYYDAMKKRIYIVGNVSGTEGALFVGTKQ
jgi:hypothetical protein